jgi:hypothetical protein
MNIALLSRRLTAVMAVGLFAAACGDGPSGSEQDKIEGTYKLSTVAVPQGGSTVNRSAPAILYEGPAIGNGQSYNIRLELLSASIVVTDQGSKYTYTGTFRLTETNNRFPTDTKTVTETGTYIYFEGDFTFVESLNSEIHIGGNGRLQNGALTVDIDDPLFEDTYTATFRR